MLFSKVRLFFPKCFSPHEVQISSSLDSSICDHWCGLEIERPQKKRLSRRLSHTLVFRFMWITGFSVSATRQTPQGWGFKSFSFTFAYLLFVDSPSIWLFEKTPFSFTFLLRMTRTYAVGIHLDRIKTERKRVYKTFFYICLHQCLSATLDGIFHLTRRMFFTSILETACRQHLKWKGLFK